MRDVAETGFATANGQRVFCVGGKSPRVYAIKSGQEEIYRNAEVSLHVIPSDPKNVWVTCRIYLLRHEACRKRRWEFGVNVRERRASSSPDAHELRCVDPGIVDWAVKFTCGDKCEAPPLAVLSDAPPSEGEYLEVIRLIMASGDDGVGWSTSANTRQKGRYVIDNLKRLMPSTPEGRLREMVLSLLLNDVVRSEICDARMKRRCLRVDASKIGEFMSSKGFAEDGDALWLSGDEGGE